MDLKLKDNALLSIDNMMNVDYILASGQCNTYLLTLAAGNNYYIIDLDIEVVSNTTEGAYVFQATQNGGSQRNYLKCTNTDANAFNWAWATNNSSGSNISFSGRCKIRIKRSTVSAMTITINGASTTSTFSYSQDNYTHPLYLLPSDGITMKIWSIQIYKVSSSSTTPSSSNIIANYIPKISYSSGHYGEAALYDTISNTFKHSSSTGSFTASADLRSSITTAFIKDCPNISGINVLRQCTGLTRVRIDIGSVTSSLQELMSYSSLTGYDDDYEEQAKPKLVGTWTINSYYTNAMLAEAQAAFDGLTIVEDTTYNWETMLANDLVAIQTIDSTAQNYNPAAAIVLQSKSKGVTLASPMITNGGRWFITKAQAAALTGTGSNTMGRWFNAVTTKTDTNGIVTSDKTATYTFTSFNEFRYFTGQTSLGSSTDSLMNFYSCTNLKYLTTPGTITSFNRYSNKAATNNNQVFYLNEVNSPSTLSYASATDTYFIQYSKTNNRYILSAYKDKYKGLDVYEHWLVAKNALTPVFRTYYQYCAPQLSYDGTDVTITVERPSTIYYTTDGSIPTTESTAYTEPFAWNGVGVIKAMAVDTTNLVGDIAYADDFYAATAQDPVITNNASIVTITAESGATIYYTIDGSCPNLDSDVYESALSFDGDFAKIRCFARVEGKNDSNVVGKICVLDDSLWGTDGDSSSFAVQSIDSTKPNYNPAVSIILYNNSKVDDFIYGNGGYTTKTTAAAIANIGTTQQSGTVNNFWFKEKTTVSNNHFIAGSYDFETFNEFKYFTSVTLYNGYTGNVVGEFGKCTKLKSITIPSHITIIYNLMFYGCSALENVYGIDNITTIGVSSFGGCTNLMLSLLPTGLTAIGKSSFNNCKSVTFTEIPTGVSTIQGDANYTRCFGNTISIPYLHLMKDGVVHNNLNYARTNSYSNFYGTTYKIYVGNGNQAHDEALLADYVAEGSWSAMISDLDTWYNYLQANPQ